MEIKTEQTTIFLEKSGSGPALLLLHGFPETHLMWNDIASLLSEKFTVVSADLRGYGNSGCPSSDPEHTPYSKRTMTTDMISIMQQLGFDKFAVAGHDRGGRVAYRLALDHPDKITALAVLDIIPTLEVWNRADKEFAIGYWPWILLAQDEPLPEQFISKSPHTIVESALNNWGTSTHSFTGIKKEAYVNQFRDAVRVHAICEEYRAAATLDYFHDQQDKKIGRKIQCPLLVLWAEGGPVDTWYHKEGGPLGIWSQWAQNVEGKPMEGGHFFPEENPEEVATALLNFFSGL